MQDVVTSTQLTLRVHHRPTHIDGANSAKPKNKLQLCQNNTPCVICMHDYINDMSRANILFDCALTDLGHNVIDNATTLCRRSEGQNNDIVGSLPAHICRRVYLLILLVYVCSDMWRKIEYFICFN